MRKGLAPQRLNPNTGLMESMELHHHVVPQRNGGLFDFMKVWPEEHRAIDPFRK
jgi:diadenosine tetraphosphate (Ap4A) HIT family hydrolase